MGGVSVDFFFRVCALSSLACFFVAFRLVQSTHWVSIFSATKFEKYCNGVSKLFNNDFPASSRKSKGVYSSLGGGTLRQTLTKNGLVLRAC